MNMSFEGGGYGLAEFRYYSFGNTEENRENSQSGDPVNWTIFKQEYLSNTSELGYK
jgi:hypothetical protein